MNPVYTTANTNIPLAIQPKGASALTIDKSATITLNDGVDSATITIADAQFLAQVHDFLEYAEKCNSEVGELWRAYKIANKLEK
jgi:hypothetical protein